MPWPRTCGARRWPRLAAGDGARLGRHSTSKRRDFLSHRKRVIKRSLWSLREERRACKSVDRAEDGHDESHPLYVSCLTSQKMAPAQTRHHIRFLHVLSHDYQRRFCSRSDVCLLLGRRDYSASILGEFHSHTQTWHHRF